MLIDPEHAPIIRQNQQKACGDVICMGQMKNIDGMLLDP